MPSYKEWLDGQDVHGRPLRLDWVNKYRANVGLDPLPAPNAADAAADQSSAQSQTPMRRVNTNRPSRKCVLGVGNAFSIVAKELGVKPQAGCSCTSLLSKMNAMGIDGCKSDRENLLEKLRENEKYYSSRKKLEAAVRAVFTGLAWKLDPCDPVAGMFDEAVRRAEQSQQ